MKKKFELQFIETLVYSNYGIKVKATQVEGESDDNFKLNSKNKSYFFKILANFIYTIKIVSCNK